MNPLSKKIPYGLHQIDDSDIQAVVDVLKNGPITQGHIVEKFGQALADYTGARYGIAVSSGTSALHLSVAALGIGPGDEVITTPMTFCATANAVLYPGAEVKFIDINAKTLNIDVNLIEKKITDKTKAIMPVDFRGHPANLPQIKKLAESYNLKIIEDAAHSIGSTYTHNGKKYYCGDGIHADFCTYSFHPVKHITTGEGGMALTNNINIADSMALLRSHGITRDSNKMTHQSVGDWYYQQIDLGFNYRMTDIQAALGNSQLNRLDDYVAIRHQIANRYNDLLLELPLSSP